MAYIQVLPEFGLIADPLVGIVTSARRIALTRP